MRPGLQMHPELPSPSGTSTNPCTEAGDPILLIMSRDGSDQRVLARVGESLVPSCRAQ